VGERERKEGRGRDKDARCALEKLTAFFALEFEKIKKKQNENKLLNPMISTYIARL
jgi:hypothetical protein